MIIGLGHRRRVGKNTVGDMLAGQLNAVGPIARTASFAAPLKEIAHKLYARFGVQPPEYYDEHPREKELIIPRLKKSYREILIELGCGCRDIFEDTWCAPVIEDALALGGVTIITDVRFPNEADAILRAGGVLIRIERPQVEASNDQADTALVDYRGWSYVFINDSANLEILERRVAEELLTALLERKLV